MGTSAIEPMPSPERPPFEPEMVHIPAGPFLMVTSDQQIDWLAQNTDLAKKWREKGYFGREQPQHNDPFFTDNDLGFRCVRS